jgi:hypothetical protein
MRVVKVNNRDTSPKPLLGVLSLQVEAAIVEAGVDIDGMMAKFGDLNGQLNTLVSAGQLSDDAGKKLENTLGEMVVHMQCFDLLAQKLSHVQQALALLEAEIPSDLCGDLSRKLDEKVKGLYSCADELKIHVGADDVASRASPELF